jgi:hypothetical protein
MDRIIIRTIDLTFPGVRSTVRQTYVRMCVCVTVCVFTRESVCLLWVRGCVCVCVTECVFTRESVCLLCVTVCLYVCVCVKKCVFRKERERERESVCICVTLRVRKRDR